MLFAESEDGSRILAAPGLRARCPACRKEVYPRCGRSNIWHWAHKFNFDCAGNRGRETFWHVAWKLLAPPEAREIPRAGHRADVVGRLGRVLELQHSKLDPRAVRRREAAYGDMVWIFDSALFAKYLRIEFAEPSNQREGSDSWGSIRWPRPWKAIQAAQRSVYLDLDPVIPGYLFRIDTMKSAADRKTMGGWFYRPKVLVDWWLYPEYLPSDFGFSRVRIIASRRPIGRELRKHVAQRKGAAAWVTDDSLVDWTALCDIQGDVYEAAELLVESQDVLVFVPRELNNSVAKLDGIQPAAMAVAERLEKRIFIWWQGFWFSPIAAVSWDVEDYHLEDWGRSCDDSNDQLLRGLVKVEPWRWSDG